MELSVMLHDKSVGSCTLEDAGLYWQVQCRCDLVSGRVERLYVGEKKLGVLEKEAEYLTMKRMVSKASYPELPPKSGYFTLYPEVKKALENTVKEDAVCEEEMWTGEILGHQLKGRKDGEYILFPYDEAQPCPCEPLLCFFEISDGFWKIPLNPEIKEEK